ncbi:TPA: hypothetical protein ACH3X2_009059 [Trebouxia sp. C0005]
MKSLFAHQDHMQFFESSLDSLDTHGQQILYDELDISILVDQEQVRCITDFLLDTDYSSLNLYRTVYKDSHSVHPVLLTVCLVSDAILTGLISRFRCGCRGLHFDTGRFFKDSAYILKLQSSGSDATESRPDGCRFSHIYF